MADNLAESIYAANLGNVALSPFDLLKCFAPLTIDTLFPNIIVILGIFCTQ